MIPGSTSLQAYSVPLRTLWLRAKDVIDIRISTAGRSLVASGESEVTLHIGGYRLLGLTLMDQKKLGLGRWLRQNGEAVEQEADDPVPAGVILYDDAGRMAYISVWPNLSNHEVTQIDRRARIYTDEEGALARIRIPVTGPRGREDALGPAAGFLSER